MNITGLKLILYSDSALGNGVFDNLTDLIYISPDTFNANFSREIAIKLEKLNDDSVRKRKISFSLALAVGGLAIPGLVFLLNGDKSPKPGLLSNLGWINIASIQVRALTSFRTSLHSGWDI